MSASGMQRWFRRETGRVSKWHAVAVEQLPPSGVIEHRRVIARCGFVTFANFAGFIEEEAGVLPISGFDDDRGVLSVVSACVGDGAAGDDERRDDVRTAGAAMSANQGPGVPVELRERLSELYVPICQVAYSWMDSRAIQNCALSLAKGTEAEIAAAGYQLVASDRLERLIVECKETLDGIYPEGAMYLEPGDLDGVGTGGEGRS